MSKYDEIDPVSFRELWQMTDGLAGDSLITEDEADAFVAGTLPPEDEARVTALLEETPEFYDELLELRRQMKEAMSHEIEGDLRRDGGTAVPMFRHVTGSMSDLALAAYSLETRVLSLGEQVGAFLLCRDRRAGHLFFARFIHPVNGVWLRFCRALIAGVVEKPGREEVVAFVSDVAARHEDLGCGTAWRDAAVLMHDCAAVLAARRRADGDEPQLSRLLISDHSSVVVKEALDWLGEAASDPRLVGHVELPVMLCEPDGRKAHTAMLRMELLDAGTGTLFAAPCMALVPLEATFKKSLELACKAARKTGAWSDAHDVRWSLTPPDGIDVAILTGGSLRTAALFGLTRLAVMAEAGCVPAKLAANIRLVMNPECICLACGLGDDMADGIQAKIDEALRNPRIALLVIECGPQVKEDIKVRYGAAVPHAPDTWLITSPCNKDEKLTLVLAATLDEAAEAAVVEQSIPDVFEWWKKTRRTAKVRRAWISAWIHKIVNRASGKIALIIGQMGSGKTSFFATLFEEMIAAKNAPVAHFIHLRDHGSDDPKLFMKSLCAQVCRKHRLPFPTPPMKIRAWSGNDMLAAAQQLVTSLMNAHDKTERPEVLYIDALDEAFDEGARFHFEGAGSIPDLLRAIEDLDPEWKSVRIVASSRDAAIEGTSHLANLKINPEAVLNLGDDQHQPCVKRDLMDFFIERLGCSEEAAETAALAANGNFLFARLYLKQPDAVGGIDELLDHCIGGGCVVLAERRGISRREAGVALITALGLQAVARASMTRGALADLLGEERRDQILDATAALPEFFDDGVLKEGTDRELRWLHSYIPEFILAGARDGARSPRLREVLTCADASAAGGSAFRAWHAEMAAACLEWRSRSGAPAAYAVRFLLSHLRHARLWDKFAMTVTDVDFLRARLQQPAGCRDLAKSLQRALKKEQTETRALPQRRLMKMIFDVLIGLSDADSGDWLHVFQELYNQLPNDVPLDFLGGVEAVLAEDGRDRVWLRITDGAERKKITHVPLPHPCGVLAVAFSPERSRSGQWHVATAGVDRMVRVWKPFPPRLVKEIDPSLTSQCGVTSRMGLPPTGVAFVNALRHNLATLWNGIRFIHADLRHEHSAPEISSSADPAGAPHSLAVPSRCDIPLVAAGYSDGAVHVCDADYPGTLVARLIAVNTLGIEHGSARPLVNTYGCISISPDGSRIAVALPDQFVRIWSLDLDAYRAVRGDNMWDACNYPKEHDACVSEAARGPLKGKLVWELSPSVDRRVDSLAWSPDGTILAIGGGYDRGVVELWDLEKQTCTLFNAHQNSVWALAWLLDTTQTAKSDASGESPLPDAAQKSAWILISGSYDRTFALWSYESILSAKEQPGERWKRHGYAGNKKVEIEFVNRATPAPLAVRAQPDVVLSIAVSPDHSLIATAGGDHEANVWDVEDLLSAANAAASPDRIPHGNVIHAASISPDGEALVTASEDGILRFWDMHSKLVAAPIHFERAAKAAQTVKFSPAGLPRAVLVGTKGDGAYLCELGDDFGELRRRRFDGISVTSVAFNPQPGSAHRIAIGHDSGKVTIHGGDDHGAVLSCPLDHSAPVRSVAFSPIAPVLASVGNDKIVIVWNLETGDCRKLQECHQGRIKSAAFSPDGRWLASGGRETIRLWNTDTWKLEETIHAHNNEIWTLEWSPCGNILASGAKDKTVRLWNMSREHQGGRKIASLPCSNSVVAIWFSPDSTTLHVADPGPERRKPGCISVEMRRHICTPEPANAGSLLMGLVSMKP